MGLCFHNERQTIMNLFSTTKNARRCTQVALHVHDWVIFNGLQSRYSRVSAGSNAGVTSGTETGSRHNSGTTQSMPVSNATPDTANQGTVRPPTGIIDNRLIFFSWFAL